MRRRCAKLKITVGGVTFVASHSLTALTALTAFAALTMANAALAEYSFENPDEYLADANDWQPWNDVLQRNAIDSALLRDCVANVDRCPKRYRGVATLIIKGRPLSLEDKVRLANRYVNKRRYRDDRTYRPAFIDGEVHRNQWRPLLETLSIGGDCEDFATAKYFLLRELGVSSDVMRVVVLWDKRERDYHAMLAVDLEDEIWFLETDGTIPRERQMWPYDYQYSLNEVGIWDHSATTEDGSG
jgi:predicted transglutaminase-like cysteine proteinase